MKKIAIDLGINNLATIYDNKGYSFIISGSSYLNTLYYYNKRISVSIKNIQVLTLG